MSVGNRIFTPLTRNSGVIYGRCALQNYGRLPELIPIFGALSLLFDFDDLVFLSILLMFGDSLRPILVYEHSSLLSRLEVTLHF